MPSRYALFCYGTLCDPDIMRRVSDHKGPGEAAKLFGYSRVALRGVPYPGILPRAHDYTEGILYRGLSRHQLRRLDSYEQNQYVRIRVPVKTAQNSQLQAWTYVLHPRYYRRSCRRPWSLKAFQARQRAAYLRTIRG